MTTIDPSGALADAANDAGAALETLMILFAGALKPDTAASINNAMRAGLRMGVLYCPNGPEAEPLVQIVLIDEKNIAVPLATMHFEMGSGTIQ